MMNSIDDNNNNAIFNLVLHYRMIKYQYVNIIWIFICFFLCLVAYLTVTCLSFFKITWCPTVSNGIKYGLKVATSYFPMEVEHIIYNNFCFKKSVFLYLESNIQYPTILIAWFTFLSDSINFTKDKYSLMSFRISKASFFFHILTLYYRFCSPFIFLLFFII